MAKREKTGICVLLAAGMVLFAGGGMRPAVADELIIEDGAGAIDDPVAVPEAQVPVDNPDDTFEFDLGDEDSIWVDASDTTLIQAEPETIVIRDGQGLQDVLNAETQAETQPPVQQEGNDLEEDGTILLPNAREEEVAEMLRELMTVESPTGSDGELLIGRYIENEMRQMGYTISEQSFHEGFLNEDYIDVPGINIVAERGADSPNRTGQIIILAAHYDSRRNPQEGDPLANDKTGAAVLMETARILQGVETDVDICFLFLSGEEDGSYGSLRFVEAVKNDLKERVRAVFCVGTLGYEGAPYLLGVGTGSTNEPAAALRSNAVLRQAEMEESAVAEEIAQVSSELAQEIADGPGAVQEALGLADSGTDYGVGNASAAAGGNRIPDWTYVLDNSGRRQNFEDAGYAAVNLFQDVTGEYELKEDGTVTRKVGTAEGVPAAQTPGSGPYGEEETEEETPESDPAAAEGAAAEGAAAAAAGTDGVNNVLSDEYLAVLLEATGQGGADEEAETESETEEGGQEEPAAAAGPVPARLAETAELLALTVSMYMQQ